MEIKELNIRQGIDQNRRLMKAFNQFEQVLAELRKKEIPEEIISTINNSVDRINTASEPEKELRKLIRKAQSLILKMIEKELKFVTKNHYRNTWLAIGMSVFGIPIGVIFGTSIGNMGLLGIGLPIGMVIGIAIGTGMDKKAFEEGRQLDLDLS